MAELSLQLGDVGTTIELAVLDENDAAVSVSGAGTLQMKLKPPVGPTRVKTAAEGSAAHKVAYTTVADDLDKVGWWSAQAYVVKGGVEYHSTVTKFEVKANL